MAGGGVYLSFEAVIERIKKHHLVNLIFVNDSYLLVCRVTTTSIA